MKRKKPAYLTLYEKIKKEIVEGVYVNGNRLPSKRVLAQNLGISIITIEHAYELLGEEGYVEARQRSGYYVIFKKEDGFYLGEKKKESSPVMVNEIEKKERETFPYSVLAKTMRRVLINYGEGIMHTVVGKGAPQLRKAIANYLARSRGIFVEDEQIVIGAGAEYFYSVLPDILGRKKKYAIETPSYEKIEQSYQMQGISVEKIPMTEEGLDSNALQSSKAEILHLSPYRSYPTRVSATASKKYEYIRWAKQNNRFLIEDDVESEFSPTAGMEETLFSLSGKTHVIYMNTFSKTLSSALRIGYMVLPTDLQKKYDEELGFRSCPVSVYIQLVVAELLENGDFERHINRIRRRRRKEKLQDGFKEK